MISDNVQRNSAGKWSGQGRGQGRYKRIHNNDAAENDDTIPRHRRTLTDEEKGTFIRYQEEMDERRDRYERIVKLSRDIIIECKRIIFQLHRISAAVKSDEKEMILKEADNRLNDVRNRLLRQIAKELYDLDQYYYVKSYDWSLEEYIEACAFYKFLRSNDLLLYSEVINSLQFESTDNDGTKKLYVELPEITYLMGLFDVGGELMRLAISEISSDNCDGAVNVVNYMRALYECYEFLGNIAHNADWTKKSQTFRESLMKVENALYKWKLRESDLPSKIGNLETSISKNLEKSTPST